jgi:ABC-type polysaccharide/polyol phosphate export permease
MSSRGSRRQPLVQLTLLRFREFIREPEALFWTLVFPVLLTTGLGVAFRNQAPDRLPVAAVTDTIAAALARDPLLIVDRLDERAARDALRTGRVVLVAEPAGAGAVVYRYDDTNPEGRTARMLADRAVQMAAGRADPIAVEDDVLREVGSRYIDFLVPGLVGMGIMSNAVWGLGFSIVDARRRKLMKRIVATPMRRRDYLLSFQLWRLMLLAFEVGVPVVFGVVAFGVPVRGSLVEMAVICLLGSLAFSALGLLLASRARTIEAVSGLMNVVMVPMWILSGVFFSSERFPDAVQPFIKALPLTALTDALRANMLRGDGLFDLGRPLAALGLCFVGSFVVAMRIFRWK